MALAFGLGLQLAVLTIAGIVLTPVIVIRAAGADEVFLSWAVFAAVAVSGVTTVLQAVRVGRVGAGYVLMMGTSGAFIAVCVTAIAEGGPAMLATLVVISSLFQFALSARLSLLRRILTPTVAGTVPNTTYSTSISVTELTGVAGVAARSVGVAVGVVFIAAAFLPKVLAAILAIPGPVVAAYATVLLSLLFVLGMTVVIKDGIDYRKGLVAGVSFWVAV